MRKTEKRPPLAWAFCANPKKYNIIDAVKYLNFDHWSVGRSDVRCGDHAIIWQTLDLKKNRGIVAFAEILENPELRTDENNQFWVKPFDGRKVARRAKVRYFVSKKLPLWVNNKKIGEFLLSLSVARGRGTTVFHLSDSEWDHLKTFVSFSSVSPEEIDASMLLRYGAIKNSQGFVLNGAERRAIEKHAMDLAMDYFRSKWGSVKDVSNNSSYDLHCRSGSEELRVEVKGTTAEGCQIILTKNEVAVAREPGYALFVLSNIALVRSNGKEPIASGGSARLFSPWSPSDQALRPISYTCELDLVDGILINT